jgi:hypothetical protein
MPHVHTGYPSGMVPGVQPGLLLLDLDGRNNSVARRPRHYVCSIDRLGSADHQVAPSGIINPLRTSPEILPSLLAYVSCMLVFPPPGGGPRQRTAEHPSCYTPSGGGVPPSVLAATTTGGGVLLSTSAPGS